MMEKAAQGHWPTTAPYGYRNNKGTKLIDVDFEKADYVKKAFELYGTGEYSIKRLINKLYDEGFTQFRPSQAKPSTSNMHHILTNKFYTGHFTYKGISRIGHHQPLISFELFNTVQKQLKSSNKPDYQKRLVAYRGLITCGHCGCSVIGDIKQKGKYVYYRCTHYKQKCPDKYIREERLQEQFADMVQNITVEDDLYQWMIESLKAINSQKDTEVKERRDFLNREISRFSSRASQLYEDKLDGIITSALYLKKSKETEEKINTLQEQLSKLEDAGQKQMALGLQILEFAKNAYPLFKTMPAIEQARFLRIVLSKCELKDGKLCPTYKKPFDILAEGSKNREWYPLLNKFRKSLYELDSFTKFKVIS